MWVDNFSGRYCTNENGTCSAHLLYVIYKLGGGGVKGRIHVTCFSKVLLCVFELQNGCIKFNHIAKFNLIKIQLQFISMMTKKKNSLQRDRQTSTQTEIHTYHAKDLILCVSKHTSSTQLITPIEKQTNSQQLTRIPLVSSYIPTVVLLTVSSIISRCSRN